MCVVCVCVFYGAVRLCRDKPLNVSGTILQTGAVGRWRGGFGWTANACGWVGVSGGSEMCTCFKLNV